MKPHWWSHCSCGHMEFFHTMTPDRKYVGPGEAWIRTCLMCVTGLCENLVRQQIATGDNVVVKRVEKS